MADCSQLPESLAPGIRRGKTKAIRTYGGLPKKYFSAPMERFFERKATGGAINIAPHFPRSLNKLYGTPELLPVTPRIDYASETYL